MCPYIVLKKSQCDLLRSKKDKKDFIYSAMSMLWSSEVMASHSITGKSSNAFKSKEAKPQLDPDKISTICGMFCNSSICK